MNLIPQRQTLAHCCLSISIAGAPACPAMVERAICHPHRQSVLARYPEDLLRVQSGEPGFAADPSKTAPISVHPRDCRKMTALPGEAERAVQQAIRLIDFSERPQDHSQPAGGYHSVVEDEPGGKAVIPLAVIGRKGLFKVRPRTGVIALKPASYAKDVKCPARRRRSGRAPGVTQGKHRRLAHRRKVGANKTSHPHAVVGREPRDGVFDPSGKLAGARKRGNRLWLAVPSAMK